VTVSKYFLVVLLAIEEHLVIESHLFTLPERVLEHEQFAFEVHTVSTDILVVTVSVEEIPFHVRGVVFILIDESFVLLLGVLDLGIENKLFASGLEPQLVKLLLLTSEVLVHFSILGLEQVDVLVRRLVVVEHGPHA